MFYNITKSIDDKIDWKAMNLDCVDIYSGYIDFDEFEENYSYFGFSKSTVAEFLNNKDSIRSSIDVYEHYSSGFISVFKQALIQDNIDRVAFFIKKNLFLVVKIKDQNESTLAMFESALVRYKQDITLEKIIFAFFEKLISGDNKILDSIGNRITALEENMLIDVPDKMINRQIFEFKKELFSYRDYYEQLIDIGEELQANENDLFFMENLRYIKIFTDKVYRLLSNVLSLIDMTVQLREVYEATLDISLNNIMKVLTVMTTIFLPLTLIAGWYGMNFKIMPELKWNYGYLYVVALGISVILLIIFYFRKKKFM